MTLKKIGAAFVSILTCLSFAAVLSAQGNKITKADIELFINLGHARGAPAKQQLMADSGRDVSSLASTQGKIGTVAAMFYANTPESQITPYLGQWGLSQAEYDMMKKRKAELIAAFKAGQGLR